jgi:hypothetical protein
VQISALLLLIVDIGEKDRSTSRKLALWMYNRCRFGMQEDIALNILLDN